MEDEMAAAYYAKAADLGNLDSMVNLGIMCSTGRGTERDVGRAVKLWSKAARRGHPAACTELAKSKLRKLENQKEKEKTRALTESSKRKEKEKKKESELDVAMRLLESAAKYEYAPAVELLKFLQEKS